MENPKCPYCGGYMRYRFFMQAPQILLVYFECSSCHSESPQYPIDPAATEQEKYAAAYAAATKREKKRKTYFEDFLQKHPKADMLHRIPLTGRDVPNLCRAIIYGETMNCPVLGCATCWNEEMEGEDE